MRACRNDFRYKKCYKAGTSKLNISKFISGEKDPFYSPPLVLLVLTKFIKLAKQLSAQAPVVQRLDNAIYWINHYPVDKC